MTPPTSKRRITYSDLGSETLQKALPSKQDLPEQSPVLTAGSKRKQCSILSWLKPVSDTVDAVSEPLIAETNPQLEGHGIGLTSDSGTGLKSDPDSAPLKLDADIEVRNVNMA